jgi:hypothetical protein
MHKQTYEAYKDMIKVDIKLLQLGLNITREKQEMVQKLEHLQKHTTRRHKSIHLFLEVKTFFGNSTQTTGSSTESSMQA